jgi:cytochrome c553
MKPDGSALENLGNVTNNTWGIGWTEDGHLLASTANRDPSFYLHIPNRYYEQVHGWTVKRLDVIADSPRIFPITDKVRQVDQHGLITACAGHALYTARSFPQEYWNRIAFLNEPTGHVISKYLVERNGTSFKTVNDFNMLASTDEWTAPIASEVGPDGSLWMIDWYNIIVQHNPIPRGFQSGKGGAYATPLRDKTHGRIYRLTWKGSTPSNTKSLAGKSPAELVAALKSDNLLWRMHAQRLLVDGGDKSVLPKLIELVKDKSIDAVGLNTAAIHALWTMHGLGLLDGSNAEANAADDEALSHPSAGVRKAAVEVMARDDAHVDLLAKMLNDADAQVRKSALLALADLPASDKAGAVVFASLKSPQNDRWLQDATAIAAAKHDAGFLKAAFAAYPAKEGNTKPISSAEQKTLETVLSSYARGPSAASVASLLAMARNADPSLAATVIATLAEKWPAETKATLSDADAQALRDWLPKLAPESKDRLLVLSQRWGRKDLFGDVYAQAVKEFGAILTDANADSSKRAEAARRLITLDDSAATVEVVLKQVDARSAPDVQIGLLSAVAESRSADAGRLLVAQWSKLTPRAQQTVLNLVLRRAAWTRAFVYALQENKVNARDLQPQHWQALITNPDRFVSGAARRLQQQAAGSSGKITASRKEIVEKFTPLASKKGDAVLGKAVFTKNCAVCHTIEGQGGQVGPDPPALAHAPRPT